MLHEMFGTSVHPVTPNIICIRRPSYLTCSYLVRARAGIVLVDAGMNSQGADVRVGLRRSHESIDSIRAILLTHWHNDHAAGAEAIRRSSGAPVYYHQSDEPFLSGHTARRGVRGWFSEIIPEWGILVLAKGLLGEATPLPVAATEFVYDGQIILDDFLAITTPGHTQGHVSYYYKPERALFAGDSLAVVNGRIRFMARPVTEDVDLARASMQKSLEREIDVLCPGHRSPLTVNVAAECKRMREYLTSGGHWPIFG
jgi:glyoxylase-like metal-dependent hydrolase (beta-lactamase superfamily II)